MILGVYQFFILIYLKYSSNLYIMYIDQVGRKFKMAADMIHYLKIWFPSKTKCHRSNILATVWPDLHTDSPEILTQSQFLSLVIWMSLQGSWKLLRIVCFVVIVHFVTCRGYTYTKAMCIAVWLYFDSTTEICLNKKLNVALYLRYISIKAGQMKLWCFCDIWFGFWSFFV